MLIFQFYLEIKQYFRSTVCLQIKAAVSLKILPAILSISFISVETLISYTGTVPPKTAKIYIS